MTGLEDNTDIKVSAVSKETTDIVDDITEPLMIECKNEDIKAATETANISNNLLEPLFLKYESFDSIVISFNEVFHGTGNLYVNILKLLRLIFISILFVLFLNLEASLIFHMTDILYKFPQGSIFLKISEISRQSNIYFWIIGFMVLSLLLVYTVKIIINNTFKKMTIEEKTYLGILGSKELMEKSKTGISECKNVWIHSTFSNKELDSEIERFENNYGSKYKVDREMITIPKIFKFVVPIVITAAISYSVKSDLSIDSKKIVLLSLLTFLGIVSIIFIGFIINFYREFIEELIEILTPKNKITELRYKRLISALRKANLIKVHKK